MVLDGADKMDTFFPDPDNQAGEHLAKYLPQRNGHIIVTTQNQNVSSRFVDHNTESIISVSPMTEEDAISLLEKSWELSMNATWR